MKKDELTDAEQTAIDDVLDKACKSSAATKGRKQVKDWRVEMKGDQEAVISTNTASRSSNMR